MLLKVEKNITQKKLEKSDKSFPIKEFWEAT